MFENMPYTNFHDINLDWIIGIVKKFNANYEEIKNDSEFVKETAEDIHQLIEQIPMFINNVMIPDNYPGTDSEKLQKCLDELKDTGGVIVLNRNYTLTENIVVRQDTNDDHAIFLVGFGKTTKIEMQNFSFTGTINDRTGGLWFDNVSFNGTGVAFDCSMLIRMHFLNCYFTNFTRCFSAGNVQGENQIFQSLYVNMCYFRRGTTVFYNDNNGIFDIHFTNNVVEQFENFFICHGQDFVALLSVTDNCIEGCGTVFEASPNQAIDTCIFNNNYFEQNETYFDLSNSLFVANMSICYNFIAEQQDIAFVNLPSSINKPYGYMKVEGNTLADRTAPTAVFKPHANATEGSYKALTFKDNRFNNLTKNNASNLILPPQPDVRYEFSGGSTNTFFVNAISYFIKAQNAKCESYNVFHTGQGNYTLILNVLDSTTAFALAFNRNDFYQIYYSNNTVELRRVTTTVI